MNYLEYFFPGTLILILLFTSIFATISIIEDRREGFLQAVLVSPVSPYAVVCGKIFGGTVIGFLQAMLFLLLAPFAGFTPGLVPLVVCVLFMFVVGLGLTGLGYLFAWKMESVAGFHAIMNLFLMPMWLLSGALFPSSGAGAGIRWVMAVNPLTYGLAAIRQALSEHRVEGQPSLGISMAVVVVFAIFTFAGTARLAGQRERGDRSE
jgi:ABC-2 type transport system permease protein